VTRPNLPADSEERRVSTVGRIHPHLEARVVDPQTGRTLPRGQVGDAVISLSTPTRASCSLRAGRRTLKLLPKRLCAPHRCCCEGGRAVRTRLQNRAPASDCFYVPTGLFKLLFLCRWASCAYGATV